VNLLTLVVTVLPVYVHKELDVIQSAGVEVRGLKTSAIARRKCQTKPVIEKYLFTPNVEPAHLDFHTALRVCTHIALENTTLTHVKVVELHSRNTALLSPAVALIIADMPLINASALMYNVESLNLQSALSTASIPIDWSMSAQEEIKCALSFSSPLL
jgi:hypothetical protein